MEEILEELPKLPKNIRQIGEKEDMVKVYIEDYANTYLKKLRPKSGQGLKVGLLLGHSKIYEGVPYLFIDGAMEIEGINANPEEIVFSNEIWTNTYEVVDKFFSGYEIQGWFLLGSLEVKLDPLSVWSLHSQYFPGKNQMLYLSPTYEVDESLYITSINGFYKMNGHCIFYERNEAMQEYMVLRKEARRIEPEVDNTVIKNFRTVMVDKKEEANHNKTVTMLYSVCTFLTLVICAIGVTMINTHDKMKSMETALVQLSVNANAIIDHETKSTEAITMITEAATEAGVIIDEIPGNVFPTTTAAEETTLEESQMEMVEMVEETTAPETETEKLVLEETIVAQTEPTVAVTNVNAGVNVHIVKEGETLYTISLHYYQTINMVDKMCEINGIENQDKISIGQQLQLP